MIYTVTLNPAVDYVVGLDNLKLGTINRNRREAVQFGGKGINVSRVLHQLGADTMALGFVAGFTGEALESGLNQTGINTDFVHVRQGMTRINVKINAMEETEINGIGPMITPQETQQLLEKLTCAQEGDMVVLSGSVPKCMEDDIYALILKRLGKGVQSVVDATGRALRCTLCHRPFLIKPNLLELQEFFEKSITTPDEIQNAAEELQKMGARNVLVSMAGDGAVLLDETGIFHRMRCPQGRVVNSVGAGDSMVAGFLAGFLQTGDYGYALKLGTAAGSATAFSATLATAERIRSVMENDQWNRLYFYRKATK